MTNGALDALVHEYRTLTNDTRKNDNLRGVIFTKIRKKYLPLVKSQFDQMRLPEEYMEQAMSIYDHLILYAISMWKGKSSFATYLFMHIKPFRTSLSKELSVLNRAGTHFSATYRLSYNIDEVEE